jgi:hypothetical protein
LDDGLQTLLVYWALDSDVWKSLRSETWRWGSGEIFGVLGKMLDRSNNLGDGADYDGREKLSRKNFINTGL